MQNGTVPWFKKLKTYYQRPEWELYDIKADGCCGKVKFNREGFSKAGCR